MSIFKTYRNMYDKPYYSKKGQVLKQKPTNIAPKIEKSMIIPARAFLKTKGKYYIGPNENPDSVDIPYYTINSTYLSHFYTSYENNYSSPRNLIVYDLSEIVPSGMKTSLLNEHNQLEELGYQFSFCTINVDSFYADFGNIPNESNLYVDAYQHAYRYHFSNNFGETKTIKLEGYLNIGEGSQVFSDVITADIGVSESTLIYPAHESQQSFITYNLYDIVTFEKLINQQPDLGIEILKFETDYNVAPDIYISMSYHVKYIKPQSYRPIIIN